MLDAAACAPGIEGKCPVLLFEENHARGACHGVTWNVSSLDSA
jgi:hypothetical protein